jgi:hypothetical protein
LKRLELPNWLAPVESKAGRLLAHAPTVATLAHGLELAGVEFIDENGGGARRAATRSSEAKTVQIGVPIGRYVSHLHSGAGRRIELCGSETPMPRLTAWRLGAEKMQTKFSFEFFSAQ